MSYVTTATEIPARQMRGKLVAGKPIQGDAELKLLAKGKSAMLTLITMKKGFDNSGHVHPEHESIGYVLSGKVEMRVGDELYTLVPGSSWFHPKGVPHTSLALEDSVVLEFHTPLREDILAL